MRSEREPGLRVGELRAWHPVHAGSMPSAVFTILQCSPAPYQPAGGPSNSQVFHWRILHGDGTTTDGLPEPLLLEWSKPLV